MNSLIILLLSQIVSAPDGRLAAVNYSAKVIADLPMNPTTIAATRKAEFERRYQKLVTAMNTFSTKYRQANGEVWPQKEAVAVRKAFRALERVEPAFEIPKN
ncbi:MAG: hypothetical protein NTV70_16910 [Acidobacteria bacterium]|nr:hypothetical protein [Acidobacteriota bacterium]